MNAPIIYIPDFVSDPDTVFAALRDELEWERRPDAPRSEYYCNDFPFPYTYGRGAGRRTYEVRPWHRLIREIQSKLQDRFGYSLEVCFLNMYRDHRDQLGWHADDSPEMDDARAIVTVSLGSEREIWFRPKDEKREPEKVVLRHGSACIMSPGMQDSWLHRIPKASFECGVRISLTFRGYVLP